MELIFFNSPPEAAYFFRRDQELLKELHAEKKRMEQERRRQEHWMKCPQCGGDMHEIYVYGGFVDRCEQCSGIFIDHERSKTILGNIESESFISILHSLLVGEEPQVRKHRKSALIH